MPKEPQTNDKNQQLILKVLSAVLLISIASLAWRSDELMAHRPIVEDGYYAFTVARNIAHGDGITIDGTHKTNGFQPLFTFSTVPLFIVAGQDPYLSIRLVMILHLLIFALSAYNFAGLVADSAAIGSGHKRPLAFWWAFFLFCSTILLFVVYFNGLETGLLLLLYVLTWRFLQRRSVNAIPNLAVVGLLLGIMVLARIDALFLVVGTCIYVFLSNRGSTLPARLWRGTLVGLVCLAISSPWWLYNYFTFGSWLPTSGQAYQSWLSIEKLSESSTHSRILDGLMGFSRALMPIVYLGQNTLEGLPSGLVRLFLTISLVVILRKPILQTYSAPHSDGVVLAKRTLSFGVVLLCTLVIMNLYYVASFGATWFYTRYFSPLAIISLLGITLGVLELRRRARFSLSFAPFLVAIPMLVVVYWLHVGRFRSEFIDLQLPLIAKHVPKNEFVAAFQTGTAGYFRKNIINLDGKVNPDAVLHRPRLLEYIQERDIDWICDEERSINEILGERRLRESGWVMVDRANHFVLFHHRTTMVEP